jgi:hypothetical protein
MKAGNNETGLFGSDRVSRAGSVLTIPQLGKFVALCMRWPNFVDEAASAEVIQGEGWQGSGAIMMSWG